MELLILVSYLVSVRCAGDTSSSSSSFLTPDSVESSGQFSGGRLTGSAYGSGESDGEAMFADLCKDSFSGKEWPSVGSGSGNVWKNSMEIEMQPDTTDTSSSLTKEPVICPHITYPSNCNSNSCRGGPSDTASVLRSCNCDSICIEYGDCCVDYEHLAPPGDHRHQFECVNIHPRFNDHSKAPDRYVKMISSCPPSQEADADTVSKCTASNDLLPPATDLSTNLTYKNIHCALCHAASEAVVWSYQLLCPSNESFTLTSVSQLMENCQGIDFLEPRPSTIHECRSRDVVTACPSYENSDYYHTSVSLAQYSSWVGKCYKYQRPVESGGVVYKNEFCALCEGVISSTMECLESTSNMKPAVSIIQLSIFNPGFIFNLPRPSSPIRLEVDHTQLSFIDHPVVKVPTSSMLLECNGSIVILNESMFDYIGDNTVLFDGEVYEILLNTTEGLPIICAMNESDHYAVITYVGSSLSMMGCVLVLLTICLFKKLRTPPMKILSNIVITNFMINLLNMLIVGDVFEQSRLCQAVAICFHFIVLAQFMWTTIMCFEILRRFYLASQLVSVISTTKKSTRRLIFYNAIAWTIPSVIVIVTITLNYTTSDLIRYGWSDNNICWINHFLSAIVACLVPVFVCLCLQCIFFLAIVILFCMSRRNKTARYRVGEAKPHPPYFRLFFALFFASNIVWVFGLLPLIFKDSEWVSYPFTVLQSLQGFVVFLGFFCSRKVLLLYFSVFKTILHRK